MTYQKSEAISRLKNSLEMAHVKLNLAFGSVLFGIPYVLFVLATRKPEPEILILFLLGFLIITGFCLWRIIGIFRKPEQYIFCKCVLDQPHSNPWLHSMYFSLVLELPDGTKRAEETHAIFATHGIIGPLMEDYVNKTVTVAYNQETGMVVVIG